MDNNDSLFTRICYVHICSGTSPVNILGIMLSTSKYQDISSYPECLGNFPDITHDFD